MRMGREEPAAAAGAEVVEEAGGQEEARTTLTINHHRHHIHPHPNPIQILPQHNPLRGVPASGQASASAVSLQQLPLLVADSPALHHHQHEATLTIKTTATEAATGLVRAHRLLSDRQERSVEEDGTMTIKEAQWEFEGKHWFWRHTKQVISLHTLTLLVQIRIVFLFQHRLFTTSRSSSPRKEGRKATLLLKMRIHRLPPPQPPRRLPLAQHLPYHLS